MVQLSRSAVSSHGCATPCLGSITAMQHCACELNGFLCLALVGTCVHEASGSWRYLSPVHVLLWGFLLGFIRVFICFYSTGSLNVVNLLCVYENE